MVVRDRILVDDLKEVDQTITVGRDEHLHYLVPILGGVLEQRHREVVLAEPGARVTIVGLFLGQGSDHLDLTLDTKHAARNTVSRTLFKGAVTDKAVFALNGTIKMTPEAHGADAYLEERALMLSPEALATTIPSLEIDANDIACKHAAAAGPIDREQLFALQSRGLDEQAAERIIIAGFFAGVVKELGGDWGAQLEKQLLTMKSSYV